jgi:hypothetical protein
MASRIIDALENDRPTQAIRMELNGDGSGEWDVIINVRQVIALVKHSTAPPGESGAFSYLRLVST